MAAKRPLVSSSGTLSEITDSDSLQIPVVGALPGSVADGAVVFLSTDGNIYKRASGAWGAMGSGQSRAFAFFS